MRISSLASVFCLIRHQYGRLNALSHEPQPLNSDLTLGAAILLCLLIVLVGGALMLRRRQARRGNSLKNLLDLADRLEADLKTCRSGLQQAHAVMSLNPDLPAASEQDAHHAIDAGLRALLQQRLWIRDRSPQASQQELDEAAQSMRGTRTGCSRCWAPEQGPARPGQRHARTHPPRVGNHDAVVAGTPPSCWARPRAIAPSSCADWCRSSNSCAPGTDESPLADEAPARTCHAAGDRQGRVAAAGARSDALVIGSDQVAELDGLVLDKPITSRTRAWRSSLPARVAVCASIPALCLLDTRSGERHVHVDTTTVRFRGCSAAEIVRYIEREQPLDCAGSFKCEGLGISLFESIDNRDPDRAGRPAIDRAGRHVAQAGMVVP